MASIDSSPTTMATISIIPLHHVVTVRLTKKNFLIWRAQLLPFLRSSKLGHVRFYPNPYGLRGIEGVSIPSKSKSLPIRINPLESIWIENNRTNLDGTMAAPTKEVPSSAASGAKMMPNPAYESWCDLDQQILSGLLSTVTKEILCDLTTATTSKEVWDSLTRQFSFSTRAHAACNDTETYKDLRDRELDSISSFLRHENVKVISSPPIPIYLAVPFKS